jgi:hypothetical protein
MQRVDHLVGAAGNRHNNAKIQTLAEKEAFTLGNGDGERKNAAQGRMGLTVAQAHCLSGSCVRQKNANKHCDENTHLGF